MQEVLAAVALIAIILLVVNKRRIRKWLMQKANEKG